MGLDTTHDCWHGPYSRFGLFRKAVCAAMGYGELDDYEGFGGDKVWPCINDAEILVSHSDCDGIIAHGDCRRLALALAAIAPLVPEWEHEIWKWICGLWAAHWKKEDVIFG